MPFKLSPDFVDLRSVVYHSTNRANLRRVAKLRRLEPATELIRKSGRTELRRTRRTGPVTLYVDGETVVLRDQDPLRLANVALENGWTEGDFVEFQNEHIFFWPGDFKTIVRSGARLLERYDKVDAVLRIPTVDLLAANPGCTPLFCAFNSGATRKQGGKAVPRGPTLFLPAFEFSRSAGEVIEMAFRCGVELPSTTQVRMSDKSWVSLSPA